MFYWNVLEPGQIRGADDGDIRQADKKINKSFMNTFAVNATLHPIKIK